MGKHKRDRKQQLREIRERRLRYQPKIQRRPFSLWHFLVEHEGEILFLGGILIIVTFFYCFNLSKKNPEKIASLSSAISQVQTKTLKQSYPQGFRIFVLADQELLALNIDTLPKELKISWDDSKILKLTDKEIRLRLGSISYRSQDLAPALTMKFPRREGKSTQIAEFNDGLSLAVELLGEYTDAGIFFAVGFNKN